MANPLENRIKEPPALMSSPPLQCLLRSIPQCVMLVRAPLRAQDEHLDGDCVYFMKHTTRLVEFDSDRPGARGPCDDLLEVCHTIHCQCDVGVS